MPSFIDRLKAHNAKKHAENKEKIDALKKKVSGEPQDVPAYSIRASIEASAQRLKENNEARKKDAAIRQENARKKREDFKKKMSAIDPGRKRMLFLVFLGISGLTALLLINTGTWPATFFNDLQFQKNWSRRDALVFAETTLVVFILLVPLQVYVLKKMADRVKPDDFK